MPDWVIPGLAWVFVVLAVGNMIVAPKFMDQPRGGASWAAWQIAANLLLIPVLGRVLGWW